MKSQVVHTENIYLYLQLQRSYMQKWDKLQAHFISKYYKTYSGLKHKVIASMDTREKEEVAQQ